MSAQEVIVEIRSWNDFVGSFLHRSSGWVFRGMGSSEHSPMSSIERLLKPLSFPPGSLDWVSRENLALGFFKERSRLYLRDLPQDDDVLGWLSLMQHYRAPTRLVDWTMSPFIACYFAFSGVDYPQDSEYVALWALNAKLLRRRIGCDLFLGRDHMGVVRHQEYRDSIMVKESFPGRETTIRDVVNSENDLFRSIVVETLDWPMPFSIISPDQRMIAQQGCFVSSGRLGDEKTSIEKLMTQQSLDEIRSKYNLPIKEWIVPNDPAPVPKNYIRKMLLPKRLAPQAMASLADMGITSDTMFPGLDGLGHATWAVVRAGAAMSLQLELGLSGVLP